MVSATSVERPEAMSCAPSGATPTVSTTPSGGERSSELDVCLDRMAAPILPRREEPDINTLCPQSTFQELPVMGKEYASLDRS